MINIGNQKFKTKKELMEYTRNLINNFNNTEEENLLSAMRHSIQFQILKFKKRFFAEHLFKYICDECMVEINQKTCHVDHKNKFKLLAEDFIKNQTFIPNKFLDDPESNRAMFKKEDYEFYLKWQQYHEAYADLRMLCAECNLKIK